MTESRPAPAADSRLARALAHTGVAAAVFLLLTLALTFPLILDFRASVPLGTVDLWSNYWNFWWWKQCLLVLHQHPYATQALFHPDGASLVFHTHSPFNMLASLPVNVLLGPAAAYNFCVLLALWLSGLGAHLLVKDQTGDARAGLLAGIVFAFFPQHMEQTLEHLNLFSTQFIPFAALFLLRLGREGGWRNVAGLGLCYALNALADWQLGILLTLLLLPLAGSVLLRAERPRTRVLGDLALSAALASLLVLPAVWPLLAGLASGETYFQKPQEAKGIDPAFLFLPSERHPLWGGLTFSFYEQHRVYRAVGFLCYLGFVPVALALLALVRRRAHALLWGALLLASLVLALGAQLTLGGELREGSWLPFALLAELPVLSLLRVANRFLVPASLALAVLAGLGWGALRIRSDARLLALAALLLLEYLWLPYPMQPVALSPYYAQLAASERKGAVLDIPFTANGRTVMNMVAQTAHARSIAGGYLSTLPPRAVASLKQDPMLSQLSGLSPDFSGVVDRQHLLALGFDHVILHKDRRGSEWEQQRAAADPRDLLQQKILRHRKPLSNQRFDALRAAFEAACGPARFEDEQIIVFDLGDVGPAPEQRPRSPS